MSLNQTRLDTTGAERSVCPSIVPVLEDQISNEERPPGPVTASASVRLVEDGFEGKGREKENATFRAPRS